MDKNSVKVAIRAETFEICMFLDRLKEYAKSYPPFKTTHLPYISPAAVTKGLLRAAETTLFQLRLHTYFIDLKENCKN